jgi:septum formation protein
MTAVILASGSQTRFTLLSAAGLTIIPVPPGVDEDAIKQSLKAEGADVGRTAEALAEVKALRVSARHNGALVIGADQMLDCEGEWFDKPSDRAQAREQLLSLRGRTHRLVTAVAVLLDGECIWHHVETAEMTMRPFSEAFLDHYLERAGDAVLSSVGAYQLEGLGAQLFSKIEGDHFTILGLPLLPLLDFLRGRGVVEQ